NLIDSFWIGMGTTRVAQRNPRHGSPLLIHRFSASLPHEVRLVPLNRADQLALHGAAGRCVALILDIYDEHVPKLLVVELLPVVTDAARRHRDHHRTRLRNNTPSDDVLRLDRWL